MAERHEVRLGNEHDGLIDDFLRKLDAFDAIGDQDSIDAFIEVCAVMSETFGFSPEELNEFIGHSRSQRDVVDL